MSAPATLPALLDTLTQSLTSAFESTPKIASLIEPPQEGVSLLDVKNELLLSYLQNLVFLILLKIRNAKGSNGNGNKKSKSKNQIVDDEEVVKKLVELRLYLDQGMRPLEDKLRFQLDKILRAADDAERSAAAAATNGSKPGEDSSDDDDGSQDDDDISDAGSVADAPASRKALRAAASGSKSSSLLAFHPSASSFLQQQQQQNPTSKSAAAAAGDDSADKTGIYRPPKIAPTSMPTTDGMRDADGIDSRQSARQRREAGFAGKSLTMDEYVADELSAAPLAQPSVGTTITRGGRATKTSREKADEDRRRDYEESNFVRLPKESKKDRAKKAKQEVGRSRMQFGGEEWRELGQGVDRISRLTQQQKGGASGRGGGTRALLEKSRKRGRDTADSARGSGFNDGTREIGDSFNKRVKYMDKGKRR